jgi:hypothetical protein
MAGTVGALAAAGVTIATGGAAALAAAAGVGAGALATTASHAVDGAQAEQHRQAAATGTLVLAVRITSPERQARATTALPEAGPTRIEPATCANADIRSKSDADVPGVDAAAWTG